MSSSNCMFAWPDRTLGATVVTAGNPWLTALPLANLTTRDISEVSRSAGVAAADTKFDIILPKITPVRLLTIDNHNASYNQATAATVTFKFSAVAVGGSELGTISNLPFWPGYYPPETPLEWEEDEYWGGTLCDADADDYKPSPNLWHVLPQVVGAKYVRVEINDPDNPAGYFQLGRCFVSNGLQPQVNLDYGASIIWKQDVIKTESWGKAAWFEILGAGREIVGSLSNLSEAEGMVMWFDRQRRLGQEGELYFVYNPDDTLGLYRQRSMLCRFGDEDSLRFPYFNAATGSFRLVEVR